MDNSYIRQNWMDDRWLFVDRQILEIEHEQATDEGIDLSTVEQEYRQLLELDYTKEENIQRAESFLDRIQFLPEIPGYPWKEPSDLPGIQASRSKLNTAGNYSALQMDISEMKDKVLGGWLGRAAGCLLGKPAEGRRRWQIEKYIKSLGRWPLDRYLPGNAPDELMRECGFCPKQGWYEESIEGMVEDDDMNYTIVGLAVMKWKGHSFTSNDIAAWWLHALPAYHVCTAERIAYRNLLNGYPPPTSAQYRNVFREWIGAQIRGDFFGFVNPGNPERAAEYAWRDASISHIKNGIYGEMWVAAMLASAFYEDDMPQVIQAGMDQIPQQSRLYSALEKILKRYEHGTSYEAMIDGFVARWNEDNPHHWCHTISNAELVAIALLWGEQDFGKTLGMAVMPGFDTDCNGATAGSVLGVMLGNERIPSYWTKPLGDELQSGVLGYNPVSFQQMAEITTELMMTG